MNDEKLRKKQSLKVIISEAIMVLAVIVMVGALALLVSGYWINADFKVERQGMLQVASLPTGADLDVDGESSWLQRTNTSKVVAAGEHNVTISKDGYDTWTKKINVSEGLLYRLHYPRLFWQERKSEKVYNASNYTMATISPDRDTLLLINGTTEWATVNLENDKIEPKKINIASYFNSTSLAEGASVGLFTGKIVDADWDRDGNHILFQVESESGPEWTLIDVHNPKNSLNLTKKFGSNFSKIEILNNSSSSLLAVQDHNLHKIDVSGQSVSAVLVESIVSFDHFENEIVFVANPKPNSYKAGIFKLGDNKTHELEKLTEPAKIVISKFYDDMFITVMRGEKISLHKKDDFTVVKEFTASFAPKEIEVGHNGEFIIMNDGNRIATLDMESNSLREWQVDGETFGWLDNDMIYAVADGELFVYDFDGYNCRALAKNASDHFPAAITKDKWLYYFSDDNLIREQITAP